MSCRKQYSPNTCGTWLIVNAYVFKIANFSSFCTLVGDRILSLKTANTRRLLRKVEGDEVGPATNVTWKNEKCTRRLQHAMFVLRDLAGRPVPGKSSPLPPLAMPVHRQDGHK